VLGLVAERPMNPYYLLKLLSRLNAGSWCPIAESSVYALMLSLEKKGCIEARDSRDGRPAAKRVYAASPAGIARLEAEILATVESHDRDFAAFDVALLLACHAPREAFLEALERRAAYWTAAAEAMARSLERLEAEAAASTALGLVRHNRRLAAAEAAACLDILEAAGADSSWTSFAALGT
jgi:DNA-binding PadR family transcriptional regulator